MGLLLYKPYCCSYYELCLLEAVIEGAALCVRSFYLAPKIDDEEEMAEE